MKLVLARAGAVVGWLLVVIGAWALFDRLYVLYLLITGQAAPGEPYQIDELAPTTTQALVSTLIACAILASGFVLANLPRRYKTDEPPGA